MKQDEFISSHWKHYLPLRNGYEPLEERPCIYPFKRFERVFYPAADQDVWHAAQRRFKRPSHGTWRAARVLSILRHHFTHNHLNPSTFAIIGDGAGALSILIRHFYPMCRLVLIDFKEQLNTQSRNLALHGMECGLTSFIEPHRLMQIAEKTIDCAVNVASMQEMNSKTIQVYFDLLRAKSNSTSRFYCLNRVEKHLMGGEVVRFDEYPWSSNDQIFIDEAWPINYFMDWKPPFVHRFDGITWQRLVNLGPGN